MVMGSPRSYLARSVRSVTRLGDGEEGPEYTDPAVSSGLCTCQACEFELLMDDAATEDVSTGSGNAAADCLHALLVLGECF